MLTLNVSIIYIIKSFCSDPWVLWFLTMPPLTCRQKVIWCLLSPSDTPCQFYPSVSTKPGSLRNTYNPTLWGKGFYDFKCVYKRTDTYVTCRVFIPQLMVTSILLFVGHAVLLGNKDFLRSWYGLFWAPGPDSSATISAGTSSSAKRRDKRRKTSISFAFHILR